MNYTPPDSPEAEHDQLVSDVRTADWLGKIAWLFIIPVVIFSIKDQIGLALLSMGVQIIIGIVYASLASKAVERHALWHKNHPDED